MHSPTGCHSYGDNCPPCEGACLSSLAPSSSSCLSHESTQLRVPNELSNCKKYLSMSLKSLISVFSMVLPAHVVIERFRGKSFQFAKLIMISFRGFFV